MLFSVSQAKDVLHRPIGPRLRRIGKLVGHEFVRFGAGAVVLGACQATTGRCGLPASVLEPEAMGSYGRAADPPRPWGGSHEEVTHA